MAQEPVKKITKKVIKRAVSRLNPEVKQTARSEHVDFQRSDVKAKKTCFFCDSKTFPVYTDINNLRRVLTERGKIVPKLRSGLCSKHQRRVTTQIKYARHLSLLPFTSRV